MTDDENSQKILVYCTHIVDIEFSIDPIEFIPRLMCLQLFACKIMQSYEKITNRVTYSLLNWFINNKLN